MGVKDVLGSLTNGHLDEPREQSPADDVLDALADEERRWVLSELGAADGPVALDDLVARAVQSDDWSGPDGSSPERAAIRLHHVQLQKLDDVDLVEYDGAAGVVALTDGGEEMASALRS